MNVSDMEKKDFDNFECDCGWEGKWAKIDMDSEDLETVCPECGDEVYGGNGLE